MPVSHILDWVAHRARFADVSAVRTERDILIRGGKLSAYLKRNIAAQVCGDAFARRILSSPITYLTYKYVLRALGVSLESFFIF